MNNTSTRLSWVGIAAVVVIAGFFLLSGGEEKKEADVAGEEDTEMDDRAAESSDGAEPRVGDEDDGADAQPAGYSDMSVLAESQPAGQTVQVSSMRLAERLWIAVYETDPDGMRTNILGAARFRPERTEGTIPLLRATEPGRTYELVVHESDEDSSFEYETDDPPLVLPGGGMITATFTAT